MKVRCVIENKEKAVYCIHPQETLFNCMKIFNSRHIGALVVLSPEAEILGIITERDVTRATWERRGGIADLKVCDVMTPEKYLTTATLEDDITEVMAVMTEKRVRHVPIVDESGLSGIMSILDVVKALYENVSEEIQMMRTNRKKVSIMTMKEKAVNIVETLKMKGWKLATAESCTGGLIASSFTEVSGVSEVFEGSIVAYANKVKLSSLQVQPETLDKFGAVSRAVVEEMVRGVAAALNVETAVAVTGIAGPSGGCEEKPVGLVYIATFIDGAVQVTENIFGGDRRDVRMQTVEQALCQLIEHLG